MVKQLAFLPSTYSQAKIHHFSLLELDNFLGITKNMPT